MESLLPESTRVLVKQHKWMSEYSCTRGRLSETRTGRTLLQTHGGTVSALERLIHGWTRTSRHTSVRVEQ